MASGAPGPDFSPVRDNVKALWRGRLGPAMSDPEVFIVEFLEARREAIVPVAALRLRSAAAGALASYLHDPADLEVAYVRPATEARVVDLWWAGRVWQLALNRLDRIALASLWSPPRLTVHAPWRRSAPIGDQAGARAPQAKREDLGLAAVSHAGLALQGKAADVLGDLDAAMRELEDRTRLSSILRQVIGAGRRAFWGGQSTSNAGPWGQPKEPGVLENLAGWLRWHTPLGAGLRGKFTDRLRLVEKLLASGDLDSALKLALALGDRKGDKKGGRFPNVLDGMRSSLDLTFTGSNPPARILGEGAYESLQSRYTELARTLEGKGDFRRAAYVYSKLLNNHLQAVLVLERGQLYREGSKLATEAGLEPVLAIRLLYKAGELQAALALARRTDCFEQLAEDSRGKDGAFHTYVIAAWTEALVTTGQPLRALQVTDRLAAGADAPQPLLDARSRWLAAAFEQQEISNQDPELVARGLLTARWGALATGSLDGFPEQLPFSGPDGGELALAGLSAALRNDGESSSRQLAELLPVLSRLAEPSRLEQADFWTTAAAPLFEKYALALIRTASARLGPTELALITGLLEKADLQVLAFDLGKLTKLYRKPASPERSRRILEPYSMTSPVRQACVLGTGQVLAWRESRLMQLFDRNGGVVWQQNLSDVVGLVPIGTGPGAIVIQQQPDGSQLLTRFASHRRSFHTIGRVRLTTFHDLTSEAHWLVQIGGDIGALDLVKLCAPEPQLEFLWSSQLTDRLRTVAFVDRPGSPQWLTLDISEGRAGVLELWTMERSGRLSTEICIPQSADGGAALRKPSVWIWNPHDPSGRMTTIEAKNDPIWITEWTIEAERKAVDYARRRLVKGIEGQDRFITCDFGRPYVRHHSGESGSHITVHLTHGAPPTFSIEHPPEVGLFCLARGCSNGLRLVVLADEAGRLFSLDTDTLSFVTL